MQLMSEAWAELLGSHERSRDSGRQDVPTHAPRAAVLACSDARVPPSVVFDQPAGSLFVVRVAGNVATPGAIASLDYAVAELGVGLVVVLGHTGCGAVTAALAGDCDGFLAPITRQLCEMLSGQETLDAASLARRNVERSLDTLAGSDSPIGHAIRHGEISVRGALYDLAHDRIETIEPPVPVPTH
jgi:carbonic anhydrase